MNSCGHFCPMLLKTWVKKQQQQQWWTCFSIPILMRQALKWSMKISWSWDSEAAYMALRSSGTERPGRLIVRHAFGLDAFSIVVIHHLIGNLSQHTFSQCCRRGLCGKKDRGKDERKEYRWNLTLSCAWVSDTGKVSLLFLSLCKTVGDRPVKTQQDRTKNKWAHTHTYTRSVSRRSIRIGQPTSHLQSCAIFMNCVILQKLTWGSKFPHSSTLVCGEKAKQNPSLEWIAQEALNERFNRSNEKPEDLKSTTTPPVT